MNLGLLSLAGFISLLERFPLVSRVWAQSAAPIFRRQTDITAPPIGLPQLTNLFSGDLVGGIFQFVVSLFALLAGLAAFGAVLYGAFRVITAGPNASQADEGKKIITGAVIGIVIMALAYLVVLYVKVSVQGILSGT